MPVFAPNPVLEGMALGGTSLCLAWAAYHDSKSMTIPKIVPFTILGLALPFHVLRGAALATSGQSVWLLGSGSPLLGALDGILLAFAGLFTGLFLFLPLWFLKASGGGDVKLFAAVAAVLGPTLSVLLLMATMLVVVAWNGVAWLAKAKGSSLLSSPMGFAPPFLVAFVLLACWVHARDQRLTAATDRVAMSGERHAR